MLLCINLKTTIFATMKNLLWIIIIPLLLGCSTTKIIEVPVEKIKIEYRDKLIHDSIYNLDSIYIKEKGDTVYSEKYKYIYKYKIEKDTVLITDSIPVVTTVEVIKEVNNLKKWQKALMGFGAAFIALGIFKVKKLL